jgi:hypothetical protein
MKIQIKHKTTQAVIFSHEQENNSMETTLLKAIENGIDIRNSDLSEHEFRDCDFRDCDFRDCNFIGCNFIGCDFRGADLSGCNIDYSSLPLWCGGQFKTDERICKQLVAHVVKIMELSEIDQPELIKKMNTYKKGWHRESEF